MALYKVSRTDADAIKLDEFVNAYVIAGGTALARKAVAHLPGVTRKNVIAERVDVAAPESAELIGVYYSEVGEPQPTEAVSDLTAYGPFGDLTADGSEPAPAEPVESAPAAW